VHLDPTFFTQMGNVMSASGDENVELEDTKKRKNRRHGSSICSECGESFLNESRLKRHMLTHAVILCLLTSTLIFIV
jgi:formylmethanofuran dehydrogenase subunit E